MKKRLSTLLTALLIASLVLSCCAALAEDAALEPITFSIFHPSSTRKIPPDDALIVQRVADYTGVTFEWLVPPAEARERLNIMLATDDLPDLISFEDPVIMEQFIQAGKLLPLEDLMKEHAPQAYNVNYESFVNRIRHEDGNMYYLPTYYDFGNPEETLPETEVCFSSRSGLLEELGWYDANTFDKIYELLTICKERYPEMSPMALALGPQGHMWALNYIGASANGLIHHGDLIFRDGEFTYFDEVPEMKAWYAFLNKIHRDGMLDIESPVMSAEMLKEKVVAGRVFSWFGPGWEIGSEFIAYMVDQGSEEIIHYYQMPKANEGVEQLTYTNYTMGLYPTGLALTTKCKDPERFMQFYELLNTEEGWLKAHGLVNYDFTGENTFENTEGYDFVVLNDKEPLLDNRKQIVASAYMGEMWGRDENWWWNRGLENFGEFTYGEVNHPKGIYDTYGDADVGMWWEPHRAKVYAEYGITGTNFYDYMRERGVDVTATSGLTLDPNSQAAIAGTNMYEYLTTQLPRIIVANTEAEFEALWAEMSEKLDGYGKALHVAEINALYQERQAKWSEE